MPYIDSSLLYRHLGLPVGKEPDASILPLVESSRKWYRRFGDPWSHVSICNIDHIENNRIFLENGKALTNSLLSGGLRHAAAKQIGVVSVSAGSEVDHEVDLRYRTKRPDEAMVLHAYATSVTEYLLERQGRRLQRQLRKKGLKVLPHYIPGYSGWESHDQVTLFNALEEHGPLRLLPSGGLQPRRSALAVFGITEKALSPGEISRYWLHKHGIKIRGKDNPTTKSSSYTFPQSALERWGREHLMVEKQPDRTLLTRFRFNGKTCSSLGLPLAFDYSVELGSKTENGRRILELNCEPAENNPHYRSMCGYLANPDRMIATLVEKSLLGLQLDKAIEELGEGSPSGCLCLQANREHKWLMVLETIHYWLTPKEAEQGKT